jgi:hypothetical protein
MKTLTIHQPYAWAVMQIEGKKIENRTWETHYRGRFWVHAGKQWRPEAAAWIRNQFGLLVPDRKDAVFGAILGSVELVDVTYDADEWTEWAVPGMCHWLLRHPKRLPEPILNIPGRQGWWNYEREV